MGLVCLWDKFVTLSEYSCKILLFVILAYLFICSVHMDTSSSNKWTAVIKNVLSCFTNKTIRHYSTQKQRHSHKIKPQNVHVEKIIIHESILNAYRKMDRLNNKTNISDYRHDNNDTTHSDKDHGLTLSNISRDNSFIQNDLYKNSYKETKNSMDSLFATDNQEDVRHKQPVMGKTALLKKINLDYSDSFIVHSIILNKYEDILNHYVNKMYKRRLSRRSNSEDEYSETLPRYSPSSISSIETPNFFENERRFYSVDELNIETPHELFNDSCYTCCNNGMSTSCSEYDPKKFLLNALGDLSLDPESQDETKAIEQSVGTSHISSLLSRSSTSLKRNQKKCFTESDHLLDLYKRELSKQTSIIFQISKALNYCKASKYFFIGRERLEAEKILLVATLTKEALMSEINILEFDTYRSMYDPRCTGDINISRITFKVKEKIEPHRHSEFEEYFLVVVTCGKNVVSSEILTQENGVIEVDKSILFQDLMTDFQMTLFVYSLVMNKKDNNNQGQFKCPSPKSIFKCNKETRHCKISYKYKNSDQIAFIPIGRCLIRNSDIPNIKNGQLNLKLEQDTMRSSLQPNFELNIETSFKLANRLPGFLTIGLDYGKNCLTWNRRWCILDGFHLKYWNYPSEETTDPLGQIDLRHSAVNKVSLAERSICARPRTLVLPILDSNSVKKYFLSADMQSDLHIWESELNFVIESLQIWHGLKTC